jgi:predicted nucleic acid-binding Zn ribbon protein
LIFRPGSAIAGLAREAEAATGLVDELRAALDPPLAEALAGARLREDGTLVVLAASSAWAARLRFEGERLLEGCRARHPEARRVEVRVRGPAVPGGD